MPAVWVPEVSLGVSLAQESLVELPGTLLLPVVLTVGVECSHCLCSTLET